MTQSLFYQKRSFFLDCGDKVSDNVILYLNLGGIILPLKTVTLGPTMGIRLLYNINAEISKQYVVAAESTRALGRLGVDTTEIVDKIIFYFYH